MVPTSWERAAAATGPDTEQVQAPAAALLAARLGGAVQLRLLEAVSDYAGAANTVLRYAVSAPGREHPQTVVVKRANRSPELMSREAAGLAFLGECEGLEGMAPRCYGHDRAAGVLVLEDMALVEEQRLGQILFAGDAGAARAGLLALTRALGTLHAAGCRRRARYEALCAEHRVVGQARHPVANLLTDLGDLPEFFDHYGVPSAPPLSADLRAVTAALLPPSPLLTFTHGDATPANAFITPAGARLLDLEASGFRHAMLDGAFPRVRFIFSVWARAIPRADQLAMAAAYRESLAAGCPEAADDAVYEPALAAASAAWMAGLCARLPLVLDQDRGWGRSTWRQRIVAGLEQFAAVADDLRRLPALAEAAQSLAGRLRSRWPPEDCHLPPYPALDPAAGAA